MTEVDLSLLQIRKLQLGELPPLPLLLLADPSLEVIQQYLPVSDVYMAEISNEVVGVYVLMSVRSTPAAIEIKNIAVKEGFQGKGIGKRLLEDACNRAKEQGFSKIVIGTADTSVMQLYLYQKVGFVFKERLENFFIDNYKEPVLENGRQAKDLIMIEKYL